MTLRYIKQALSWLGTKPVSTSLKAVMLTTIALMPPMREAWFLSTVIKPGSIACKAAMITFIPMKLIYEKIALAQNPT